MGDGGSYFLVILLSSLFIISSQNIDNSLNIIQPLFLLFIPLIDMTYVIFCRLAKGNSPFHPDKLHIHHRLIATGLRTNNSFLIWLISLIVILLCFLIINF